MKKIMDGNSAVAYVSYGYSEVIGLFPITPSSTMAEKVEKWSKKNRLNMFDEEVSTTTLNSEAAVAGTMHGLLKSGVLTTAYTSSQGLLLMIPTLYKMVGELLPGVIHVASRSVATSNLNIHGDHSDVMAIRQTGTVILSSGSVQEAALFSAVAHESAIQGRLPVVHFFDGFDTSHELRKIEMPTYNELFDQFGKSGIDSFRQHSMSNFSPRLSGSIQSPDLFFQQRESSNIVYQIMEKLIEDSIKRLNPLFHTNCSTVDYYGDSRAESVIVLMGSAQEIVKEALASPLLKNEKVGLVVIHLYRPFPKKRFLEKLPKTVKQLAVLDRTKEPGATGEPLLLDVQKSCSEDERPVTVIGGRYGIGGKKLTISQVYSVFSELVSPTRKSEFTIGITDDITNLSLATPTVNQVKDETSVIIEFLGLGGDGAISGAKDFIKLIGEHTSLDIKADFEYPPSKARGLTIGRMLLSHKTIQSTDYDVESDIIVCDQLQYINDHNLIERLKNNGILILNYGASSTQLEKKLTVEVKKLLAQKNIQLFIIPASKIARKFELGPKINCLMVSALLKRIDWLPFDTTIVWYKELLLQHQYMLDEEYKESVFSAIEESVDKMICFSIDAEWENLVVDKIGTSYQDFDTTIIDPIKKYQGNSITTSDILSNRMLDGSIPMGKTGALTIVQAEKLPCWNSEQCFQCNLCSTVCPHGVIRPFVKKTDKGSGTYKKNRNYDYMIEINAEKCTNCSLCVEACPAKGKALYMKEVNEKDIRTSMDRWRDSVSTNHNDDIISSNQTYNELQFVEPLMKYSAACAGCGETPYVRILTQLFGDRLSMANATGCSSIWSGTSPYSAFYESKNNSGPVWATSLFENNSAFGYGIDLGFKLQQKKVYQLMLKIKNNPNYSIDIRKLSEDVLLSQGNDVVLISQFIKTISTTQDELLNKIVGMKQYLINRSHWILGGDGWAYDIDFGGLDHLISKGENCNILILDNEGYANTGGQVSKGTPLGAKAKFATGGNQYSKKDFGYYAMQYKNVFVAQVSLFSHPSYTIEALKAADEHDGVSIIIAYSPCVLNQATISPIELSKLAVKSGYWPIYTYQNEKMELMNYPPNIELLQKYFSVQTRFDYPEFTENRLIEFFSESKKRYFNYTLLKEIGEMKDNIMTKC